MGSTKSRSLVVDWSNRILAADVDEVNIVTARSQCLLPGKSIVLVILQHVF